VQLKFFGSWTPEEDLEDLSERVRKRSISSSKWLILGLKTGKIWGFQ
jgi:hypothetical protein